MKILLVSQIIKTNYKNPLIYKGRRETNYSSEDSDDGTSSTSSINNYVIEKVSYSSSYDAHGGVVEIGTNTYEF
jgi:hypothetical protein